jgi:hypothetical protein
LLEDTKRRAKKHAMGEAAQMRKDRETERKRKRLLKRLSDNDEDDEDDDDEDDDDEMGRQPGDSAMPSLHEEEEVIGSIPTSDWDDLEQQEEEGDAPQ